MTQSSPMSDDPTGREAARSPSLLATAARGAFEWKFLLALDVAAAVEAWARRELTPDPHGAGVGAAAGRYRVTTLHLDTAALDLYHRTRGAGARKLRLRRYDDGQDLHVERKVRRGDQVSKQRAALAGGVARLHAAPSLAAFFAAEADVATAAAAGAFLREFAAEVAGGGFVPSARATYLRTAFFAQNQDGAHRLTLDRAIRGELCPRPRVEPVADGTPLLADSAILELKFVGAPPDRFKSLVSDYRLVPTGVSKYRRLLATLLGPSGDATGGDAGGGIGDARGDDPVVRCERQ
ncbi:MAG: polyphosphate polymerase domain-containing protein [Planctomycetes bacterium]|nr:polyphosphate polymerase domain-containing protein [Planctomycetota bacterium]